VLLASGCGTQDGKDTSDSGSRPEGTKLDAMVGELQELADVALASTGEESEKRLAVRGLVVRAMGVAPEEIAEVEGDMLRLAKVDTISKGTADMAAVEHLRTLMQESQNVVVISESIRGLGLVRDIDSVPTMLDLMSHEDSRVGEAAQYSVSRILGVRPYRQKDLTVFYHKMYQMMLSNNPNFHADFKDPESKRRKAGL
jgi:hypothetical protein